MLAHELIAFGKGLKYFTSDGDTEITYSIGDTIFFYAKASQSNDLKY